MTRSFDSTENWLSTLMTLCVTAIVKGSNTGANSGS